MTESRAIIQIKYRVDTATQLIGTGVDGKAYEDLELAIKALEKQIPKKPYIQQVEIDYYEHDCMECPSCDCFLGYAYECKEEHYQCNYCPHCGQKLNW